MTLPRKKVIVLFAPLQHDLEVDGFMLRTNGFEVIACWLPDQVKAAVALGVRENLSNEIHAIVLRISVGTYSQVAAAQRLAADLNEAVKDIPVILVDRYNATSDKILVDAAIRGEGGYASLLLHYIRTLRSGRKAVREIKLGGMREYSHHLRAQREGRVCNA
jgi:hypothetical protein